MKQGLAAVLVVVAAAASPAVAGEAVAPYRIHLAVAEEPPQYSNPAEMAETLTSVRKALSGMREFTVVEDPATAEVVLTLADRRQGSRPGGYVGLQGTRSGDAFDPSRMVDRPELWIRAEVKAGTASAELYGGTSASWGASSRELAKEVRKWLKKNAAAARPPAGS